MKIHITNVYGMIANRLISNYQTRFSEIARKFGAYELGIYNYPAWNEGEKELCKRIDGIISAVESNDIVLLQVPTGNGAIFEKKMINEIRKVENTKIVLIWHSLKYFAEYHDELIDLVEYEISTVNVKEAISYEEEFFIEKILLDAIQFISFGEINVKKEECCNKDIELKNVMAKIDCKLERIEAIEKTIYNIRNNKI